MGSNVGQFVYPNEGIILKLSPFIFTLMILRRCTSFRLISDNHFLSSSHHQVPILVYYSSRRESYCFSREVYYRSLSHLSLEQHILAAVFSLTLIDEWTLHFPSLNYHSRYTLALIWR